MDDGRLEQLEQVLVLRARHRKPPALPVGFTGSVMHDVRAIADRRSDFWSLFTFAARRFVPAGALAATASCGYALVSERFLNQALLTLSLHGGGSSYILARLLP